MRAATRPATCSASTSGCDGRGIGFATVMDIPQELSADYFDGQSARARRATLRVVGDQLAIEAEDVVCTVPLGQLAWPERTRHGARLLHLPDGGSLHCRDSGAWDAWSAHATGRRDSLVVRAQQHWRWVGASLLALALILGVGYRWGLPLAAGLVVARLPLAVDEGVGEAALAAIDRGDLIGPSRMDPARQAAIRRSFSDAVARLPAGTVPPARLEFRSGRSIGPNAFALPGGVIIVTDELVERVHGERGMVLGVLGHELGHLQHRHGMRMLIQAGAVSAAAGLLFGDFSAMFALVPTWLAQAKYGRDAEREADVEAVGLLRANGISPAVMASFFAAVHPPRQGGGDASGPLSSLGLGLATHPADAERIAFFEKAAGAR
jgi:Zn-dependent protease with chaperone function